MNRDLGQSQTRPGWTGGGVGPAMVAAKPGLWSQVKEAVGMAWRGGAKPLSAYGPAEMAALEGVSLSGEGAASGGGWFARAMGKVPWLGRAAPWAGKAVGGLGAALSGIDVVTGLREEYQAGRKGELGGVPLMHGLGHLLSGGALGGTFGGVYGALGGVGATALGSMGAALAGNISYGMYGPPPIKVQIDPSPDLRAKVRSDASATINEGAARQVEGDY